ncbi:hypothetical protein ACE6ED_22400 [Paenibacillus sp. CN-4]|uniref:hypothetical protein n=1 Tax=Paenibacillus nanchangensis TaxID=3348343 RepID=UPI00397B3A5D
MTTARSAKFRILLTAGLLSGLIGIAPSRASANVFGDMYNGLEQFSELPGEVNRLQESYRETVDELNKARQDLNETRDTLDNAVEEMNAYRTENAELAEQNRKLTQMVDELRDERAAREKYIRRIRVTVFTGIGLLAGYFVLVRLIRLGMRSRSGRSETVIAPKTRFRKGKNNR